MCFDKLILSAYVDNELHGSLISDIKDHLETCSKCREYTVAVNSIKKQLRFADMNVDPFTKDAVWNRLSHSTSTDKGLDFWHRGFVISPSFMVSISFLFIVVLSISIFLAIPNNNNNNLLFTGNTSDLSTDYNIFPFDIPVDNIEKILAYFDIHDEPMEVFFNFPGSSDFVIQGEPRFLKKNDYVAGR